MQCLLFIIYYIREGLPTLRKFNAALLGCGFFFELRFFADFDRYGAGERWGGAQRPFSSLRRIKRRLRAAHRRVAKNNLISG
jgi:hypothetical protein